MFIEEKEMLNYLWGCMILIGVVYGTMKGRFTEITQAIIDSAGDSVSLCITMAGVMALWMGIMKVAENAGIMETTNRIIQPFIRFLFPRIPRGHAAGKYITANIVANVFGLGWAATPAGLKAMEALGQLEGEENGRASNEMCNFLILNISSLQLIPVNMIAYRSQYGSENPAAIVGPGIAATAVSTLAAIAFCKIMDRRGRRHL